MDEFPLTRKIGVSPEDQNPEKDLLLSSYSFHLPDELIQAYPRMHFGQTRDQSRLMIVDPVREEVTHTSFRNLSDFLPKSVTFVMNHTKVFKARLIGTRVDSEGKVEFFLLKRVASKQWWGLMRASKKIEPGFEFEVRGIRGRVAEKREGPDGNEYFAIFEVDPLEADLGETPLPPYIVKRRKEIETIEGIKSPDSKISDEIQDYNTVYAKGTVDDESVGSVASPTAGRHFTHELIRDLEYIGHRFEEVCLDIGVGTFRSIKSEIITDHRMHAELGRIDDSVCARLNQDRLCGRPILAVGTTSSRTLEGFFDLEKNELMHGRREVDLFLHPGSMRRFEVVDALLTNFHLPESSLMLMISHFLEQGKNAGFGRAFALQVYEEAIRERYGFFSYGDAMLILGKQFQEKIK